MAVMEDRIDTETHVDSSDVRVFGTRTMPGGEGGVDRTLLTGPEDFLLMRETDGAWKEACDADRLMREAIDCDVDGELVRAMTVLLNRAYWFGRGRMAPLQFAHRS